jgi:hypothetical protein
MGGSDTIALFERRIMKKTLFALVSISLALALTGCSISLLRTPAPLPTQLVLPTIINPVATSTIVAPTPTSGPSPTVNVPTLTPGAAIPTTGGAITQIPGGIIPGAPSGPYGVILVAPGDVLNIRTAPGAGSPVSGSFAATATNVMRTGPSSMAGGDLWVQVQNSGGGSGWVNSNFLTEYVTSSAFCADGRVNTLLTSFANGLTASNGETLASLVSPVHGMAVRLWRTSNPVIFDREHARWVFDSTYEHNWGAAPQSGQDTLGAFHVAVLPTWLDVFNAQYTLSCNSVQAGGASYATSWPVVYTNVNFFSLYKPGPAGNELSWRTLVIGVEYVLGKPYVFSVTQMNWEP